MVVNSSYKKHLLYGFNSFKSDYPKILKTLLYDDRFKLHTQLKSGGLDISATYKVKCGSITKEVIFLDAIRFYSGSLKEFLETTGCEIKKGDVQHDLITLENLEEQIVAQNIHDYLKADVVGLSEAISKYFKIVLDQTGINMAEDGVYTSASLAEKIYFRNYYPKLKHQIFNIGD